MDYTKVAEAILEDVTTPEQAAQAVNIFAKLIAVLISGVKDAETCEKVCDSVTMAIRVTARSIGGWEGATQVMTAEQFVADHLQPEKAGG